MKPHIPTAVMAIVVVLLVAAIGHHYAHKRG